MKAEHVKRWVAVFGSLSGWGSVTTRIVDALTAHGIERAGQLTALTERDLLGWRGVGDRCVAEVRRVLAAHGMALAGEGYPSPEEVEAAINELTALTEEPGRYGGDLPGGAARD